MAEEAHIQSAQLRAPEPSVDRIEELASRILSGDILLPKFQRDFVWKRQQIIDLLDSIANNYPVGSILLWRSKAQLRNERAIADLQISPTKLDYPVNYLLDGQQRLSTICGALNWRGSDPTSRWNIAYDLRERAFLHLETLDNPPFHQIRLNQIPNAAAYFQQVGLLESGSHADGQELANRARALFNRFKDYKVATVTLHDMSIEAVAPIFERINSKGTPLTIVDLMRAATWSEDFDLVDSIETITTELASKDFGGVEKKSILRSISAAAGGGFAESSIDLLRKHKSEDLKVAVTTTKTAYAQAVDFLATDLHIPSDRQLPYVNQMVVLSEVFRLLRNPTAAQRVELSKWFWRTAVSGYFGGWNTGNMAADQLAVSRFATGVTESLEVPAINPTSDIWVKREFRSNTAHSKILILLLCFNRPIDLLTGQRIDVRDALYHGNNKEFHHFFPRDYLNNSKGIDLRKANSLSNIVMLTSASNKIISNRAPSDYLQQVKREQGSNLDSVLRSNLIPTDAFELALADDFQGFAAARAKAIHEEVKKLTGW